MNKKTFLMVMILSIVLAACAPVAAEPPMEKPAEAMVEKNTEAPMEKPTEEMMANTPSAVEVMGDTNMDSPVWFGTQLTDARTGESFSVNDFNGKVVLVETLAMWCSNCKKQQLQVLELHKQLGERDDFVSLGLDVDINENLADLKTYVENNGFTWTYSVATPEIASEISKLYGQQFLNPPSTPMLIIDRKGEAHLLPFGIKSAEDLMKALEPFLNENM
jgi:thiol-disulfide isomerase/thioredoxin